ncbi:MAG TPA: hypothetical protein PK529_01305, partial [Verrucomicrobiales bacterium]|nr:hypothetical protein [Verrucomicrobiales bacterium]
IWLAYPRPAPERETGLNLSLDFATTFAKGGGWISRNSESAPVDPEAQPGAAPAWVYTSWANGLEKASIPLLGENEPPAKYRVRVHLAAPGTDSAGHDPGPPRQFSLRLQGKPVSEGIVIENASTKVKILEFDNIEVTRFLEIEEIATPGGGEDLARMPVINGIEVLRRG